MIERFKIIKLSDFHEKQYTKTLTLLNILLTL